MTPEAKAAQMPQIAIILQMQDIVFTLISTSESEEPLETENMFYNLLANYSQTMNGLIAQLNKAWNDMESIMGLENAG